MNLLRCFRRAPFASVAYRAESLAAPATDDLTIDVVGPGQRLTLPQRQYLHCRNSTLSILYLLRLRGCGAGWVFLARSGQQYVHSTFVTRTWLYRREIPIMVESRALMFGPCFTEDAFRGRAMYPRMLQYAVNFLRNRQYGPFYICVSPDNLASIRGIEKAGFTRCGLWVGTKRGFNIQVTSRRVGD
jgi:hypothetical protein